MTSMMQGFPPVPEGQVELAGIVSSRLRELYHRMRSTSSATSATPNRQTSAQQHIDDRA